MSLTKRQIIDEAFAELGLASEFYEMTPAQYQRAMRRMDMMVANWQANAIRIGYNMGSPAGSGDLDDDSLVDDVSISAVMLGLAIELAPSFGKQLAPATLSNFKDAYDNLVQNAVSQLPEIQWGSTLPQGSGNKYWRYGSRSPFFNPPVVVETGGAEEAIEYPPSYAESQPGLENGNS